MRKHPWLIARASLSSPSLLSWWCLDNELALELVISCGYPRFKGCVSSPSASQPVNFACPATHLYSLGHCFVSTDSAEILCGFVLKRRCLWPERPSHTFLSVFHLSYALNIKDVHPSALISRDYCIRDSSVWRIPAHLVQNNWTETQPTDSSSWNSNGSNSSFWGVFWSYPSNIPTNKLLMVFASYFGGFAVKVKILILWLSAPAASGWVTHWFFSCKSRCLSV